MGKKMKRIFMIGMWHLGCVNAVGMNKLGNEVTCFDFNTNVIEEFRKGTIPVYEVGMNELFTKEIKFSTDISDCKDSDFIFITYDIDTTGIDSSTERMKCETLLKKLLVELKPYAKGKTVIVRSQVTIGFCDSLKVGLECNVCYMPENLRLGTSIDNFFNPDWLVFGVTFKNNSMLPYAEGVVELFSTLKCVQMFLTLKEAEFSKLAMNCYLATMISFSSEISNLCEIHGLNSKNIINVLKQDKRVSRYAPVMPGLGFSGGTIERDVISARKLGTTPLLDAVLFVNEERKGYVLKRIKSSLGTLDGKTITFFGATYKTGTKTLRDSPTAKEILRFKKEKGVTLQIFDPTVSGELEGIQIINDIKGIHKIHQMRCLKRDKPVSDIVTDAIIIMNDSKIWKEIDYSSLNPSIILDTKGIFDKNLILPGKVKHIEIGVSNE
jgi:UDPglucose 6-dehydrogenase